MSPHITEALGDVFSDLGIYYSIWSGTYLYIPIEYIFMYTYIYYSVWSGIRPRRQVIIVFANRWKLRLFHQPFFYPPTRWLMDRSHRTLALSARSSGVHQCSDLMDETLGFTGRSGV